MPPYTCAQCHAHVADCDCPPCDCCGESGVPLFAGECRECRVTDDGFTLTPTGETMTGAELIAAERQRQVDVEDWTPEHDDEHTAKQMQAAAEAYMVYGCNPRFRSDPPMLWPWERTAWKPDHREIRNLVKAGALIAAEIDRLQRKAAMP